MKSIPTEKDSHTSTLTKQHIITGLCSHVYSPDLEKLTYEFRGILSGGHW